MKANEREMVCVYEKLFRDKETKRQSRKGMGDSETPLITLSQLYDTFLLTIRYKLIKSVNYSDSAERVERKISDSEGTREIIQKMSYFLSSSFPSPYSCRFQ